MEQDISLLQQLARVYPQQVWPLLLLIGVGLRTSMVLTWIAVSALILLSANKLFQSWQAK